MMKGFGLVHGYLNLFVTKRRSDWRTRVMTYNFVRVPPFRGIMGPTENVNLVMQIVYTGPQTANYSIIWAFMIDLINWMIA